MGSYWIKAGECVAVRGGEGHRRVFQLNPGNERGRTARKGEEGKGFRSMKSQAEDLQGERRKRAFLRRAF